MAEQETLVEEEKKNDDFLITSNETEVTCGVAWDFFGQKIDLDITAVALDIYSLEMDAAYYNQTNILNDAIIHSMDNTDGIGDGDDETIQINLKQLPGECHSVWFIVNAYSGGSFQDVETARFKFYNANKEELHGYSIAMGGYNNTAMLLGVLYRDVNEQDWHYKKIETAGNGLNFVESRPILIENLNLIYSEEIINDRPRDKTKKYELKKSDQYVIDPSIDKVTLGLGWDPASSGIDVDGSVIVYDKLPNSDELEEQVIVSFSNLEFNDSIKHHGDSLTGQGSGDDEQIDMFLNKMGDDTIDILCVVINIYGGATSFASINNCFARLVDDNDNELCRFTLSGGAYKTRAMVMCTINKKKNGCWSLNALGIGCNGSTAKESADDCKQVCMGKEINVNNGDQSNSGNDGDDDECCCVLL